MARARPTSRRRRSAAAIGPLGTPCERPFAAGLVVVLLGARVAVDQLGEERLFSGHMIQHLLLADVAPILLLLGLAAAAPAAGGAPPAAARAAARPARPPGHGARAATWG